MSHPSGVRPEISRGEIIFIALLIERAPSNNWQLDNGADGRARLKPRKIEHRGMKRKPRIQVPR